jgi:hypothetical protein
LPLASIHLVADKANLFGNSALVRSGLLILLALLLRRRRNHRIQKLTSLTVGFFSRLSLRSVYGETHPEARLSRGRVYPDLTTMARDDPPDDIQS